MFLDTSKTVAKSGKVYTRILLRMSYRENGKVKHRTVGNLTGCTPKEVAAIRFALQNKDTLPQVTHKSNGVADYSSRQGLSVGAVCFLYEIARRLGIVAALGNNRDGKRALWQVLARVIDQGSRLSAVRLATSHAACDVVGLDGFNEDDLYANLDWLCGNQGRIEQRLFNRRFNDKKPELFLYDVTSSYLEGMHNELAEFGYNRDGKKGKKQIVVGLLCDQFGDPLSIEVFRGNMTDTKTMPAQIRKTAERFGCSEVTFVGDRGMIKTNVIDELHEHEGFHYITALTKPQIEKLMKDGILQMSLFDEHVVEVSDESKGLRYILRRNPHRVQELEQSRHEKKRSIEGLVAKKNIYLAEHPRAGVATAEKEVTAKIRRLKLEEWLSVNTEQRRLYLVVSEEKLKDETKLDGCYVIKTDLVKEIADTQTVHGRYKDLAYVERAFRTSKTAELEMRPINVRKESRTRGHIFVVMLAYMIVRELTRLWQDIDLTVEEGINELSTLCLTELCVNGVAQCNVVPQPRESVKQLIDKAKVILPPVLPTRGVLVATRKKLTKNRQHHKISTS